MRVETSVGSDGSVGIIVISESHNESTLLTVISQMKFSETLMAGDGSLSGAGLSMTFSHTPVGRP